MAPSLTQAHFSIATVSSDGSDSKVIFHAQVHTDSPDGNGYATSPQWAPNRANIVFVKGPDLYSPGIARMRPDGSRLRQLLRAPDRHHHFGAPTYFPDGSRIAYVRCVGYCHGSLMAMWTDGSHRHLLFQPLRFAEPIISPAGDRIAGVVEDSESCTDIVSSDLGGGDEQSLTHNCDDFKGYAYEPAWQPIH